MNPPYNAKPIGIPEKYKKDWGKAKDGKEDPTKGLVFIHYLSDVIAEINKELEKNDKPRKEVKLAVLLPVSAAIGTSTIIENEKIEMLKNNTLEAVFTLPNEIFYPGASASACCMLFTLGKPHKKSDGTVNEMVSIVILLKKQMQLLLVILLQLVFIKMRSLSRVIIWWLYEPNG